MEKFMRLAYVKF